jgi:hypothetical protein
MDYGNVEEKEINVRFLQVGRFVFQHCAPQLTLL